MPETRKIRIRAVESIGISKLWGHLYRGPV